MAKITKDDQKILYAALLAQGQQDPSLWDFMDEEQLEKAEEIHLEMEAEVEDEEADMETIVYHAALTALLHGDSDPWDNLGDDLIDLADEIIATQVDEDEEDVSKEISSEYEEYDEDDEEAIDEEDVW